ncbi:hypothetical protein GL325_06735 [Aeromicrobium sp. 636]|uniref:Uncharacterized protein n=1 Tax=Aeromicrobium senzhongii TaxID=2663859 RepID=A0A8I0EUS8_9ACTN|nr:MULTISPECIES: hypothetical protein [Aeromicrobium]MBC9226008.1 hypothetical protein [Aeromicrobium senzhongii]MCQ3998115.1 hypothetical protein [Aeromicrobium sp. 636]
MRAWISVLLVLAVAGCGGSDDAPTPEAGSTAASSTGVASQAAGTIDPLAITSFTCRKVAGGAWKVKGTVQNSGQKVRDYRLTVFIGQQTGPARTVDLDKVKAGSSVPFALDPIVAAPDGPCRMQAAVVH